MQIFYPDNTTKPKHGIVQAQYGAPSGSFVNARGAFGFDGTDAANALTGIKFLASSGTFTGTIKVYGIKGSGSGVISFPGADFSTNDSGAFATLANAFVPANDFSVDIIYAAFNNATIGNVYNAFIATIDSSGNITGTVATATAFTTTATGTQQHKFDLSSPVTLTAGTNYIFALVITSGTGTSACRAVVNTTSSTGYSNLPQDVGKMIALGSTSKRYWYAQNSASPSSGAPSSSSSSGNYAIGVRAQL